MVEENQVADQQTDNPSEPTQQEVNWRESLPEDLKEDPSLKSIQDVPGLAKSFIHAQKMVEWVPDTMTVVRKHAMTFKKFDTMAQTQFTWERSVCYRTGEKRSVSYRTGEVQS